MPSPAALPASIQEAFVTPAPAENSGSSCFESYVHVPSPLVVGGMQRRAVFVPSQVAS